jgi:hypothetical protein
VVAGLVVAGLDEVLRPHEGRLAVDDEELAVVAQVRPLELPLERPDREHRSPVDSRGREPKLFGGSLCRRCRFPIPPCWPATLENLVTEDRISFTLKEKAKETAL